MNRPFSLKGEILSAIMVAIFFVNSSGAISDNDMICPNNLVLAEVRSLREEQGRILAVLKIVHVYKGLDDLGARLFNISAIKGGESNLRILSFRIPLKEGESGIWLLRYKDDKIEVDRKPYDVLQWIVLPARKGVENSRFEEAKKWAEAVEMVTKADPKDRLDLMKKFTVNETPEISDWAFYVLAIGNTGDPSHFFDELLAKGKLSICGQIALDKAQSSVKGKAWNASGERLNLLQKCAAGPLSEYEAIRVVERLGDIQQAGEIEDKILLGILRTAVDNQQMPFEDRESALWVVGHISKCGKDEGLAFKLLVDEIKGAKEEQIRLAAAHALRNFVPLDKERTAIVKTLKETIQDKRVADVLQEALEPRKEDKGMDGR